MANVVSLKSISIPASLYGIGRRVFFNASGLEKITFNRNSQIIYIAARVFENATALNSINIPAGVREIEGYAFLNTPMLREITFDQNSQIASIHATAFSRSGLTLVVIGESALDRLNVERLALNMQPLRFGENNNFYGKTNVKIVSRKQEADMLHLITSEVGYKKPPRYGLGYIKESLGLLPPREKTRPPLPKALADYASSFLMEKDVVPKSPAALAARAAAANATEGGARKSRRRMRSIRRRSRKASSARKMQTGGVEDRRYSRDWESRWPRQMNKTERQMTREVGLSGPGRPGNQSSLANPSIMLPRNVINNITGYTTPQGRQYKGYGGKQKRRRRTMKRK